MRHCLLSVLTLLVLAGCGGGDGSDAGRVRDEGADGKQPRKFRIAVIPKGTSHDFWLSVRFGAEKAARELDNVEVIWKGTLKESNKTGQIEIIESFIVQRIDGICLAPIDRETLVSVTARAQKKNIPTVIFDSGLADESVYVSYVATDNYKGGVLAARRMGKVLDGKGDVILLRYQAGSQSTENREKGFLETLAKEFPAINVLSENQRATSDISEVTLKCSSLLIKFQDTVDGVFTVCEPHNKGMLTSLVQKRLAGKVKFIAFDSDPRMIDGLEEGTVHGVVLQDPVNMGYMAVKTMAAHLAGKSVDKRISTGEFVATPENKDDEKIAQVLKPEKYE